jgi:MFS transporter, DHA1 family, multidrug resistance protein
MTSLMRNSALATLVTVARGKTPTFSRQGINVKDIEEAAEDVLETPPPEQETAVPEEKDEQASNANNVKEMVVTWNGKDDPDNPQNWPVSQKIWITLLISFYTFAVYVGSSIFTPAAPYIQEQFGVNHAEGALGLALYVLGYGTGSLLFSPLSEIPAIGRNPPYAFAGILFVVLCIPSSLVDNYPGQMVLRFLVGFMGSPLLATAGATLGDIWAPPMMPFAIAIWSVVASASPAVGPVLSTYAIADLDWHWYSWILLMISGPVVLLILVALPETSAQTILYYRVKRLRQEGYKNVTTEAEQKQKGLSLSGILVDAFIKPWEMNIKDPALLFTTVYLGSVYGIFYSFFESLPLVYPVFYNFPATNTALIFLAVIVGALIGFAAHVTYMTKRVFPKLMNGTFGELENHLIGGMVAGPFISIGLFIFAWTSRPSIHWIVPTIGLALNIIGIYVIAQSIFMYIPNIVSLPYPMSQAEY